MCFDAQSIPGSLVGSADDPAAGVTPLVLPAAAATVAPATLRVGLVGCGGFARFAVQQYRRLPGVSIEVVADVDPVAAERAAADFEAAVLPPQRVLEHQGLDLVYIATPPALHYEQAAAALQAGRHVLVEKPLATTLAHAEELVALAAERDRLCVANLLERYCPLALAVRRLIESRLLGGLVHGVFLNEAGDEAFQPGHWFWDRRMSGGIFVEHGIHFFDLVASWLGVGRVVAAARGVRCPPRTGGVVTGDGHAGSNGDGQGDGRGRSDAERGGPCEELVACTCRYPLDHALALPGEPRHPHSGILFHFEHGFHQPALLERQEMRLVFERGEVRIFEWVPTRGSLRALVDEWAVEALVAELPGAVVRVLDRLAGGPRVVQGRFQEWRATAIVEIDFASGGDRLTVYAEAVRALAADQVARIRDPGHVRRLTEADCVAAVSLACEADRLALAAD